MNSEKNVLLFTEDYLFNNSQTESSQNTDSKQNSGSDKVTIDTFFYDNLYVEYTFETGEIDLYMKRPDELFELLYHSDVAQNFRIRNFYSKNSAFVLKTDCDNDKKVYYLDYYTRTNFVKFINSTTKFEESKNKFIQKSLPLIYNIGIASHSSRLIENSKYFKKNLDDGILKEYKHLFVKYSCVAAYIPISCILESTIGDINNYIATGNLDLDTLKRRLHELECFREVCPNSCSLISNFINDPYNTDLRELCDDLRKNITNIENLMNIYMEDELNIQNRGENDDCK